MLKSTALSSLFCFAAAAFILNFVLPGLLATRHPGEIQAEVFEAAIALLLGIVIGAPLFLLGLSYSSGVIVNLVAEFMLGREPSPEAARIAGAKALGRLFALSVYEAILSWTGVILAVGLLMLSALLPDSGFYGDAAPFVSLLAVLGFILSFGMLPIVLIRYALAPAAATLENLGPMAAAKRSVQLMRGSPWQPSGYNTAWMFVGAILLLALLLLPGFTAALDAFGLSGEVRIFVGVPFLTEIVSGAASLLPLYLAVWTLVPVWCVGATILYFERRVRIEGFDIQMLSSDVRANDKRSRFEL